MNIYFVVSRKTKDAICRGEHVIEILAAKKYKVNKSILMKSLEDEEKDLVGTVQCHMDSVKNCDVLIYESTQISVGGGFIVAFALNNNKHVLCLHDKTSKTRPSVIMRGIRSPFLTFREYTDETLEEVMIGYLKGVKKDLHTRFILTISSGKDRFINWASEEWGINKAEVVRRSLRDTIQADAEYQEFLRSKQFS